MAGCAALLLVACCVITPTLACDWLTHCGKLRNSTMALVEMMGGPLTEEESPVHFPYSLYNRVQRAEVDCQLVFIRESLKLITKLYHHGNLSSVSWDTHLTEHFLVTVDRQIEELDSCVPPLTELDSRLRRRMKKYYRRLETGTLHHTGGSGASWEVIRSETRRHLDQMDILANQIKPATARGSYATS